LKEFGLVVEPQQDVVVDGLLLEGLNLLLKGAVGILGLDEPVLKDLDICVCFYVSLF
jgi:hypothetical protein